MCAKLMNTFNIALGVVLLVLSVLGYFWGVPKLGETSRVPTKWGLRTAFPGIVLIGAVVGFILAAKGYYQ